MYIQMYVYMYILYEYIICIYYFAIFSSFELSKKFLVYNCSYTSRARLLRRAFRGTRDGSVNPKELDTSTGWS